MSSLSLSPCQPVCRSPATVLDRVARDQGARSSVADDDSADRDPGGVPIRTPAIMTPAPMAARRPDGNRALGEVGVLLAAPRPWSWPVVRDRPELSHGG